MNFLKPTVLALLMIAATPSFGAQLNYGKYFGAIQMSGRPDAIAVSLDAFVVQPNDVASYPEMAVIVRANLGGYVSPEYVGYYYYDPTYNFEDGIVELNDPKNDLSATLTVTNTGTQTILEGPVTERLTNAKGVMRVVMNLDDSIETPARAGTKLNFQSMLRGKYVGTCGDHNAELQIETGQVMQAEMPGNAMHGYSITGRLGFADIPFLDSASDGSRYYSLNVYSAGSYSPYTGRLVLQGPLGILNCKKNSNSLRCQSSGYESGGDCFLTKRLEAPTSPVQFSPDFYLNVPAAFKKPLPPPNPPANDELVKALNGDFYGFLHYENRDQYQLLEMSVTATTSTENSHILNRVLVSPTILLRVGSSWGGLPVEEVQFPQRVFFNDPVFTFSGRQSGLFAVIGNWRIGYLSGVLYSRAYGRIGTFEMQKGARPRLVPGMKLVGNPIGHFVGPQEADSPVQKFWSVDVTSPNSIGTGNSLDAISPLIARYSSYGTVKSFDSATYDLNSGELTFLIKDPKGDRLLNGLAGSNQTLHLLWPVGPELSAPMEPYETFTYSANVSNAGGK